MRPDRRVAQRFCGFALVDALIAVVVLAAGVTSLAALNGGLVSDTNQSKNRALATALAQEKIEELRTNLVNDAGGATGNNFAALASGSDACGSGTYACGSAGFARSWAVSDQGAVPNAKEIAVTVTWNDAKDGAQTMTLSSVVGWDQPLLSVYGRDDGDFDDVGDFPKPTGGGELYFSDPGDLGLDDETLVENNTDYDLQLREFEHGVVLYDADEGVQVWMTTSPGVIKIEGTIKLSTDQPPRHFTNNDMYGNLRSIAADAGICSEKINDNGTTEGTDATDDDYLDFVCYVGRYWYGRIGVMAVDGGMLVHVHERDSSHPDRVCPLTYRYGTSCEVTGQYELSGFATPFCADSAVNANFLPAETVVTHSETGDPLLYGTLANQNFMIQDGDVGCTSEVGIEEVAISGVISLTGDDVYRGITVNQINATVSGATSGCVVTEEGADQTVGSYTCGVPSDWTGTLTFGGSSCSGLPIVVTDWEATAIGSNQTRDVAVSGCVGQTVTIAGTLSSTAVAFNPVVSLVDDEQNEVVGVTCTVPGSSGFDYECVGVPVNTSGTITADSENDCPTLTAGFTVPDAESDTFIVDLGSGSWSVDTCEPVNYAFGGTLSRASKWEIGSGNNKVDVASVTVDYSLGGGQAQRCLERAVSKNDGNQIYDCSNIVAHPGSVVTITASACNADGSECMPVAPNSRQITLGNSATIAGQNFSFTSE